MAFVLPPPSLRPWPRVERERVANYPVFGVDRTRLVVPMTGAPQDFFTIACTDWCNVIPVTDDDEVVFVWQYRFGTEAFSLETPGGIMDAGESPEDGARRELLEETGYVARTVERLHVVEPNPALQGNRCYTLLARGARKDAPTRFDATEECEVVLVPRRRIPDLLDGGVITHAIIVAALETFLRRG